MIPATSSSTQFRPSICPRQSTVSALPSNIGLRRKFRIVAESKLFGHSLLHPALPPAVQIPNAFTYAVPVQFCSAHLLPFYGNYAIFTPPKNRVCAPQTKRP
jgi:hypothetical protein